MNKKGFLTAIGELIILLLAFLGLTGTVTEDIPNLYEDLQENICVPLQNNWKLCFINDSGIIVNGNYKDLRINLRSEGENTVNCNIGSGYFKFETKCKDEFGYLYEKEDFELDVYVDNNYIKSIPKYQIYGLFYNIARNPQKIGKNLWKNVEGAFALRGIIYLAEHPEIVGEKND